MHMCFLKAKKQLAHRLPMTLLTESGVALCDENSKRQHGDQVHVMSANAE